MLAVRIAGILLLLAGTLGLVQGGFSYTKSTREARLGPIQFSVEEKERIRVPVWLGAGAIAVGGVLLLLAGHRR